MTSEVESLRKQLREAQEREQVERQLREEVQQSQAEERRLREDVQRHYELRTGKTTLPEYLDACHTHLCLGLRIQPDSTQSTQGDAANAENKPRPNWIKPWLEFDDDQVQTWKRIMDSNFVLQQHFTSLHTLEESGEAIRRRQMGSELDLNNFARFTVEDPVSQIIERLFEDEDLRNHFDLKGSVRFENHSNTLSPDRAAEQMQPCNTSKRQRRSERLRSNVSNLDRGASSEIMESAPTIKSFRPRADQFCVYNISSADGATEYRVPALTIEYKAPHKLTLGHIYKGLGEMELDEVVEVGENESVEIRCRRLVAAVITQGFSYMVRAGVEYGEIYTGEATIFLRIPNDPSTVYYALSVPTGDVGSQTDWSESSDQPNRLHLTAIGQAVPFTLRALQTPPRSIKWRTEALRQLRTWNVVVKEIEEAIADEEVPSSEYRPPPRLNQDLRKSPIQFRQRKVKPKGTTCTSATSSFSGNDDDHPDTPSRPPQPTNSNTSRTSVKSTKVDGNSKRHDGYSGANRQRNLGRFCTPQCLIGIIQGGELDQMCPNVQEHGQGCHRLDHRTFIQQVHGVLHGQLDYCEEMNVHGARGALFKIKVPEFGYTIVAKATGVECVRDLIHESAIYHRLLPIQGKYISVHLGDIGVDSLLYYAGAVRIVHMMLLSFGGFPIRSPIPQSLMEDAIRGLQAMHQLGVLQKDPTARNILVHTERRGATWIDFERAILITPRVILGSLPVNRKRKLNSHREKGSLEENLEENTIAFTKEIARAGAELTKFVVKS